MGGGDTRFVECTLSVTEQKEFQSFQRHFTVKLDNKIEILEDYSAQYYINILYIKNRT